MPYEPILPDGAHLKPSRRYDGAFHPVAFDNATGERLDITAWREIPEAIASSEPNTNVWSYAIEPDDESTTSAESFAASFGSAIGEALAPVIIFGGISAARKIKDYLKHKIYLKKQKKPDSVETAAEVSKAPPAIEQRSSNEVSVDELQYIGLTSEEYDELLQRRDFLDDILSRTVILAEPEQEQIDAANLPELEKISRLQLEHGQYIAHILPQGATASEAQMRN